MCVYRDMVSGGVMSRCSVMVCGMLVTPGIGHGMSCTLRNTKASFLLGRCGSLIVHGSHFPGIQCFPFHKDDPSL